MASQLRFEGAELEDVLERVRTEVGPNARIVGANRIRKGGIGGFFAREGFEVVVDVVEAEAEPKPIAKPRSRSPRARVPASVLDLADDVSESEQEQVIDLSEPSVSTERGDFGAMLERLSRELDDEEASFEPLHFGEPVAPNEHYRRVTSETPPAVEPEPEPEPAPAPAPVAAPEAAPAPDPRLLALGLPAALVPSTAASGDLRTALVQRLAQLPAPPALPRTSGVVIAVVGIGTAPIALARRLADELDLDAEHVMLATPEDMSDLSHPEEAEAFRRSCRRRAEPTIVACSTGPGRAQLGWAHRILDRLEPTITWAVVESSCKPEDVEHRIGLLGGVDVLALTGVADTVSPAAVLELGVAIGRLGSKPATPAAWADLLMERLER
ncbi:MAG TPA: hypothetical protein VN636_01470 [Acidimicrobiia bacterium]|nr:hypothetical protein [Acidimicrobiia bacterium]